MFSPLFPEERIIFGLHPASYFETTLADFKKLYNKNDAKLIAKQVCHSMTATLDHIDVSLAEYADQRIYSAHSNSLQHRSAIRWLCSDRWRCRDRLLR